MTTRRNNSAVLVTIVFTFVLATEYVFAQYFHDWKFKTGALVIGNRIAGYLSFFGLLYRIALLRRATFESKLVVGIVFGSLFGALSCGEIYPIDTTTQPVDKEVLQTFGDSRKIVVRQYENAKTTAKIQDTVTVKDVFIFRRHYKN